MKFRTLIHVNEMARWNVALGSIDNFLNAVDSNEIDIVVLANGEAVKEYLVCRDGLHAKDRFCRETTGPISMMTSLNQKGVSFLACRNALAAHGINAKDLAEFVIVVPAGMVVLVELQSKGFAYIKP
jgi:intracellular sulfur oxidation DsrE/DsrF family protein